MDGPESLLSAAAVRERAERLHAIALADGLEHWRLDPGRLAQVADRIAATTRDQYPTLDVPFHARWRHFVVGGRDLWAELPSGTDPHARARAAFDLAITSVLLDAGAGPAWRFRDAPTATTTTRSEGLAVASLRLFAEGRLSGRASDPLRADGVRLAGLTEHDLGVAFQVGPDNPLVGLDGRAALLRRLGERTLRAPELFARADDPRPGGLYDVLRERADGGALPAPAILDLLLEALGPVWENRPTLDGVPLGDCWPHPALGAPDTAAGYAPLHKLSQWLSYSLVEPLEAAGVRVTDLDGLTGLAEYRNGGLFYDAGVLILRDPADAARAWPVGSPLVVGWRSLTVALLDAVAPLVRERLDVSAEAFPLARVLEGGAWAAGRRIARERRADGGPPLTVISDGTVF